MEQSNLPSNSLMDKKDTTKPEKEKIIPVVSGKVKKRKKSFGEKFVNSFINEGVDDVGTFVKEEIFIPTIKKAILDVISMIFYGRPNTPDKSTGSIINYNSMSRGRTYLMGSAPAPKRVAKRTFNDIWFEDKSDMESVVANLNQIVQTYGVVSVADLFELSGQSSLHTDNNYGWTNLEAMEVVKNHGGYILKMPPPRPID